MNAPCRQSLLVVDPELGALLSPERRAAAERELVVPVVELRAGAWDGARLAITDPANLGLSLISGVLAREVVVRQTVSTELLGAEDLVRPWPLEPQPRLLPVAVRWNVLAGARAAVLDRRLSHQLNHYPEIRTVLVDRLNARAERQAVAQAISNLNGVEHRVEALMWHYADRWGRVATDGVVIPLVLSHRLLGQIVGARRPTVSAALARLSDERRLRRRGDGTWLLTGQPPEPAPTALEAIIRPPRRFDRPPTPQKPRVATRAGRRGPLVVEPSR